MVSGTSAASDRRATVSGNSLARNPRGIVGGSAVAANREIALIDLLDRLLQGGIVIHGDITLAVADIDLVELDLRLLVSAIDKALNP